LFPAGVTGGTRPVPPRKLPWLFGGELNVVNQERRRFPSIFFGRKNDRDLVTGKSAEFERICL